MNLLTVGKIVGIALTISGTIVTSIVSGKENKIVLEKLVEKHLNK